MLLRFSITSRRSGRGGKQTEDLQVSRLWMCGNPSVSIHVTTSMEFELILHFVVAVGAEEPLAEHMMVADFFRKFIITDFD
jgi:hypothetical protein